VCECVCVCVCVCVCSSCTYNRVFMHTAVAVRCSVLHCVAVCCSRGGELHRVDTMQSLRMFTYTSGGSDSLAR